MTTYEVLQIKTIPTHADLLAQNYSFFGWIRIRKDEFKELQISPTQEDEPTLEESTETLKTNQTIYPGSPGFSDWGDRYAITQPSPNDSSTYDGYQNLYFKRDLATPHKDELDSLKKRFDDIKDKANSKEEEINHKKAVGHFLFVFGALPVAIGFFLLMGGLITSVLAAVSPDDFAPLKETGIGLLIGGGFTFTIGITLVFLSFFKGLPPKKEKELRQELKSIQSQEAEILAQAASLRPNAHFKQFNIRVEAA